MSQFFLARNFTLSGLRHGRKIVRSGTFKLIFDANALVDKFFFKCIRVVNSFFFFEKETNGPYGTALSSRKHLFDKQFEGKHKFI